MVKKLIEKTDILKKANSKIAGEKVNSTDEVQAQVRKARTTGTAKTPAEVVSNIKNGKKTKFNF